VIRLTLQQSLADAEFTGGPSVLGSRRQLGDLSLRFRALDSWRGICALAVVMFHFPIIGAIRAFPLFAHGYLFVDFFFVLSGFVIATAWEERLSQPDQTWRFLLRRFGRLWPLHVTMLAVFVGFSLIHHDIGRDERHSAPAILTNLLLIQGLGIHKDLTWNGPSWSISVEAMLYVVFAFLAPLRWRMWAYGALIAIGLIVLRNWAPSGMASTFDYGAFRGFAGFFTGALLTRLRPRALGLPGELAAVAVVAIFVALDRFTILAPAVFGFAVYAFAHAHGPITRVLERRVFTRLGDWSYSTYMTHSAVAAVIWNLGPKMGLTHAGDFLASSSSAVTAIVAIGYIGAVIGVSSVTYPLIEKPGRQLFNTWASAPRKAALVSQ
jgi:peptidoglycan/LPS O-acetylase OafA/YrhL